MRCILNIQYTNISSVPNYSVETKMNYLAICLFSFNGSLIHANTHGKNIQTSLPNHFFTSFLYDIEEYKDGKTIQEYKISNKTYCINAFPTFQNNKLNEIYVIFLETNQVNLSLK